MNFGKGEYITIDPPPEVTGATNRQPFLEWINEKAKAGYFFCGTAQVAENGGDVAVFWRKEL